MYYLLDSYKSTLHTNVLINLYFITAYQNIWYQRGKVKYCQSSILEIRNMVVVVVLDDPFRGMGAWRNSTETQQFGHSPRSGPEVRNGRSSAKGGAPEKLKYGTVQEEVS